MNITKRQSSFPVIEFRSPIDRLFDDLVSGSIRSVANGCAAEAAWAPAMDLSENEQEIRVRVEVPGIEAERLDVTLEKNVLSISGSREETTCEEGERFHRTERRSGSFVRRVALPVEVDAERIEAEVTNGVLMVRLPKSAAATPRKIAVKSPTT